MSRFAVTTCRTCGTDVDGTLAFAAYSYCAEHHAEIRERCLEHVFVAEGLEGVALRDGRDRPDHGPGFIDCRCNACGAMWVARVGDPCIWCADALERMVAWQAEKLLDPELPDVADSRFVIACEAWAGRLARAVETETITEAHARAAWTRRLGHVTAAA